MVKARRWVLARPLEGEPRLDDFRLEEQDLPAPGPGQILVQTTFISVDPYQRVLGAQALRLGDTMMGSQVGRVLESRADGFPVGSLVTGYFGWATHVVVDPTEVPFDFDAARVVQPLADLPLSLYLGVLGMPGVTAYAGLFGVLDLKPGDWLFVSGAAGAVGSAVVQLARAHGIKVVACAGSDAKVRWLQQELGVEAAYNYKTRTTEDVLDEVAPDGVDGYFDNVGGPISSAVISRMRRGARAAVCGSISSYNDDQQLAPTVQKHLVFRRLSLIGFTVWQHRHLWDEAVSKIQALIREGKFLYRETVATGFENTPKAYMGLFSGENTGKAIVKV